jgi:hypothetical protein
MERKSLFLPSREVALSSRHLEGHAGFRGEVWNIIGDCSYWVEAKEVIGNGEEDSEKLWSSTGFL